MTDQRRNLTLEEIGKLAGVSRSTVSRVLNDHPHVRPEIRTLVHSMIEETGYLPNQAARALVSNRTGLIGLVMPTNVDELFGDPYYSALVHGIKQGCEEEGTFFSLFPVYGDVGESTILPILLATGFVDGVIVTAGPHSDGLIRTLRDRGKDLVVVGHSAEDQGVRRVDVDNRAGSASAVAHLCDIGRLRVGYVGPTLDFVFGAERLDGYRDALQNAGRTFDDRLVRLVEPTADDAYDATVSLLPEQPDAIHASTDIMADAALRALRDHGRRVPTDVAVVGFDGLPRSRPTDPLLTTVVQPVGEVGRIAVRLLRAAEPERSTEILSTTLRVGESCGAMPMSRPA